MKLYFSIISISLLIFGCSFKKKEATSNKEEQINIPESFITYDFKTISDTSGPCASDSTKTACLNISISYPILSEGPFQNVISNINKNIKRSIFENLFINEKPKSFQSFIDELSTEYKEVIESFEDYTTNWQLEVSSDIIYQTPKLISIATSIYSYTGGAHGNSILVYKSYNLKTGEEITLSDFLKEGFEEVLNSAAEIEFRMNNEIPPSTKLSEADYFFEDDKFKLNDNFAVMDNSLIFYFNSYEITNYAAGPDELEIRISDYKDFIKLNSVIDEN